MKKSDQKKKNRDNKRAKARLTHERRLQAKGMVGLVRTPLSDMEAHKLKLEQDLEQITKICTYFIAEIEKLDLSQMEQDVLTERDDLLNNLRKMRLDLEALASRLKKASADLSELTTLQTMQTVLDQMLAMQSAVDEAYIKTSAFLKKVAPEPIPDESDPSDDVVPVAPLLDLEPAGCGCGGDCASPCENCTCTPDAEIKPIDFDYPLSDTESMSMADGTTSD